MRSFFLLPIMDCLWKTVHSMNVSLDNVNASRNLWYLTVPSVIYATVACMEGMDAESGLTLAESIWELSKVTVNRLHPISVYQALSFLFKCPFCRPNLVFRIRSLIYVWVTAKFLLRYSILLKQAAVSYTVNEKRKVKFVARRDGFSSHCFSSRAML